MQSWPRPTHTTPFSSAQAAIEEAEYAVLDAVLARRDADVLAAAI
jgi:hypothetical protein